ncbi:alkaline phosphatase synthesis sensor protein PhoR [bacterium BMS3Abin05]|nr:alkaline phosphatase synthesis sensor protein PhoR [bacterium BMS3Abin05]GBE28075.1 alkaline phosphatase synthesis sensor protein PhoR [bacterium BMS3Bbin03]HDK36433.1 hybrid sensor histidine kinase/response regulator [Bacteroidota bacterium]HDZ12920.1 hybrid sensor histidine kinase/response regulator [Bacteroidota bacterium]
MKSEKTPRARILVVDDEDIVLRFCERSLKKIDYAIKTAENGADALKILHENEIDVVLSDLKMEIMDGLELLKNIKRDHPHVEVIMMTGFASVENAIESMKLGAYDFLLKPLKIEQMRLVVNKCVEKISMSREVRELRAVKKKLEELQEIKDKFIAITSHELRTPVTHAKSYFSFLDEDAFSEKEKEEFKHVIRNALDDMERIVLDMFDIVKAESRELVPQKTLFDLNKMIQEILLEIRFDLQDRKLNIEFQPADKIPEIAADRFQMRRVVQELLSNAIRFTPDGGTITIHTSKENEFFKLIVEDTGVGIPQEDLGHIFELFYEVQDSNLHSSSKRGFLGGSTGIGLPLIKGIVEAHDGYVKIQSEEGKGTKVLVFIPEISPDGQN